MISGMMIIAGLIVLAIFSVFVTLRCEAQKHCAICNEIYPSTNHLMKHAIAKPITGGKA